MTTPDPQRPLYRWTGRGVNNTERHSRAHTECAGTRNIRRCAHTFFIVGGHEIAATPKKDRMADRAAAPQLRAPELHHPAAGDFHSLRKHSAREHLLSSRVMHTHTSANEAPLGAKINLPVGVCAAELNHLPRMRLEATRPHELGSDDRRTQWFLWPRCYAQPEGAFTRQQRRITTGAGSLAAAPASTRGGGPAEPCHVSVGEREVAAPPARG